MQHIISAETLNGLRDAVKTVETRRLLVNESDITYVLGGVSFLLASVQQVVEDIAARIEEMPDDDGADIATYAEHNHLASLTARIAS